MVKILIVEDDPAISRIIIRHLSKSGKYEFVQASTAEEALLVSLDRIDTILLDVMLPDISGIELCGLLRKRHHCPIIFISCLDNSETIINALGMGGDDYITKPFDTEILEARIEANLRRVHMDSVSKNDNILYCGGIELNGQTHDLIRSGHVYHLEDMEFQILSFLMQHPERIYTTSELYQEVWGQPCYGDIRTVTVHIFNLRQMLEDNPKKPKRLVNVWGKGYCFRSETNEPRENN